MELKELCFVRDFGDHLHLMNRDLTDLCILTDEMEDEEEQNSLSSRLIYLQMWALKHQLDLIEDKFSEFKEIIDEKYKAEWDKVREKTDSQPF